MWMWFCRFLSALDADVHVVSAYVHEFHPDRPLVRRGFHRRAHHKENSIIPQQVAHLD